MTIQDLREFVKSNPDLHGEQIRVGIVQYDKWFEQMSPAERFTDPGMYREGSPNVLSSPERPFVYLVRDENLLGVEVRLV